jgi:hypothetical protein
MFQPVPKPDERPKRKSIKRRDRAQAFKSPTEDRYTPPMFIGGPMAEPLTPEQRERIAKGETDVV